MQEERADVLEGLFLKQKHSSSAKISSERRVRSRCDDGAWKATSVETALGDEGHLIPAPGRELRGFTPK